MTPPVPAHQIADVLATNLEVVFDGLCVHRYGAPLSLERVDADPAATTGFRLHRADLPELRVHFAIRHVGGNVYDVRGTVEDGPSRAFTYSLPEPVSHVVPRAPRLAREVAAFLLDALERRVGSDRLRDEVRSGPASAPSGPSASRSASSPRS